MKPVRSYRRNRGITLIEILISLAIGFVVLAAVIVSFVGSGQAGRYQAALTQMNQDAQTALNLLSREVQLAGYAAQTDIVLNAGTGKLEMHYHDLTCGTGACPADVTNNAAYISGCDADSAAHAAPFVDPRAVALACRAVGAVSNSSGFSVVYEADVKNTVPAGGVPSDCLGNAITQNTGAKGGFYVAQNRYFIDLSASGRPELYCASPAGPLGTTKQPILENVEDMQIWYGLAPNVVTNVAATRQVLSYAKAGKDTTANTINWSVANGDPQAWARVVSVRICVLLRSSQPVLTSEDVVSDKDCNSNAVVTSDKYLRRAYYTTATLRSKMSF